MSSISSICATLLLLVAPTIHAGEPRELAPDEQPPGTLHVRMDERPRITVGIDEADIVGSDQRALQAAVEYIAALGGGTVEIGPGVYEMRDSLHVRSGVTVRGTRGKTVLRKADGVSSALALDGDYGEEQVTLADVEGFDVGDGIAVWDAQSGGFHTTVARVIGRKGNTLAIDKPLNADCMAGNQARAATVFPVISGYDANGVEIADITIEGNQANNEYLNGCRGAGIFFYRCHGAVIRGCEVRDYHGDGISFQQSNDVTVEDCLSERNSSLGFHPGSGSQRPTVLRCLARNNGHDGLFLCWRVKYGRFEGNILEGNGRYGISIGHKDTDNFFKLNQIRGNRLAGVYFRDEAEGMAGHRNRLEENVIENNGTAESVAGIVIDGHTRDTVLKSNVIRDTRPEKDRQQLVGIRIGEQAGEVALEENEITAEVSVEDARE